MNLMSHLTQFTWQEALMLCIGGLLIYLAIEKKMEPSLLLPMGFGAILANLPLSGAVTQGAVAGPLNILFDAGFSSGKALADVLWGSGPVWYFPHSVPGGAVL